MDEKNKIRRVSKHLILGTSRATRGAYQNYMYLQDPTESRGGFFVKLLKTSWFERIWYPAFFISGILCLAIIRPFTFELCFAVLSLWLYMFANNFLANGKLLGIILSIISSCLYVVVSFFAKVYGEVIINVLLYIPLDIAAVCTFKKNKNSETNELDVRGLNAKAWLITIALTLVGSAAVFLILYFLPGQQSPILNTLTIVLFLVALFLRNARYKEFWWFNLLGNAISIVMWIVVSTSSSDLIYSLPFALSSLAALLNNIYGIIMWQRLYRAEVVNGGISINRNIKINHVIKLRRQYNEALRWDKKVAERRKRRRARRKNKSVEE